MRQAVAAAVLATAAVCALAQTAPAQTPAPPAAAEPPAPSAEAGRQAYTSFCVRCHGINLVVSGSAFYDLRTFPKAEKERFVDSVTNGKRQMPAWGSVLKPEAVESIWLYVGSVNGW